jgi:asparagine synthetase B (glutamine-hydrolysing)
MDDPREVTVVVRLRDLAVEHGEERLIRVGRRRAASTGYLAGCPADPAASLVDAYCREGTGFSRNLLGQFAAILIDEDQRIVVLAQDSLGLRTLYYSLESGRLIVSTHLDAVARAGRRGEVDPSYFASYLVCGMLPWVRTPLLGVEKLALGATLVIDASGVRERLRPWRPSIRARSSPRRPEETLRALLDEAVAAALPRTGRSACELSGGLDSTSVFATARRFDPDCAALTLFSAAGLIGDDEPYAAAVIAALGGPWLRLDMDDYPLFAASPDRAAAEPGDETRDLLRRAYGDVLAGAGIDVVLTGVGGDVVFGFGGLPPVHLADPVAAGAWRAAFADAASWARARDDSRPWTHLLITFGLRPAWRHFWRRGLLSGAQRPPRWLEPEFARLGRAHGGDRQRTPRVAAPGRQYLWESVYRMAANEAASSARRRLPADTRHPLLHRPLVAFMLDQPWPQRDDGSQDRALQRRALSDRLPTVVAERSSKGGDQRLREASQARSVIDDWAPGSGLIERGWIDPGLWRAQVARAGFGVFDGLPTFDAAIASDLWLKTFTAQFASR